MQAFRLWIEKRYGISLPDYEALHSWSVKNISDFWGAFVEYAHIPFRKKADAVLEKQSPMYLSRWFIGAEVNWSEIALASRRHSNRIAVESFDETGARASWSYSSLYRRVSAFSALLHNEGFGPRDRLAAFMPNTEETLLTLLATVARGGIFSSTSPDFGAGAAADRLTQFSPKILVASTHYILKGKKTSVLDTIIEIAARVSGLQVLLVFRADDAELLRLKTALPAIKIIPVSTEYEIPAEIQFEPYTFQDPLYVMYSSGTTGLPKCIVQGHGVIINHVKEHRLHVGANEGDKIFYYTTCGWMMYNWLVSGLCYGASLVLFDGNPFHRGAARLWKLAVETQLDIFGTSAKYLTTLREHDFDGRDFTANCKIRTILSTGSVLPPEGFAYVYEKIHPTARLSSISGGTDLNGCFALGNPDLPVYAGELQSRGLGMAVEIFDDGGKSVVGEMGELVCTEPFPSMPLSFLGDDSHKKYHASYFERFPGVWAHGDFAELKLNGGMVFSGRSDATLNPGGVRIGTAEIYRVLELIPFIEDSLIIGRPVGTDDEEVVLFVKMKQGELTDAERSVIKKSISEKVSARHVPAKIFEVKGIPYTINGKKVELAVKYIALGRPITNRETIANKEVLAEFETILQGP